MKGTTSEDGCMKAIGVPYRFNSNNEIGIAVYSEAEGNERVKNTEITANVYYVR